VSASGAGVSANVSRTTDWNRKALIV